MNYEQFRNVDELTHDEIIAQEIDEIVHKRKTSTSSPRKKEVSHKSKEGIKTEPEKPKEEPNKNAAQDANLVACEQEHEMEAILKHFKKVNNKANRESMKKLCKEFKSNDDLKPYNRDNFYTFLSASADFRKIRSEKTVSAKKKVATKKKAKKKVQQKPKTIIIENDEPEGKWLTVIVSAIAILAIVVVAYLLFDTATTVEEPTSTVAAIVNGVPIYNSDVNMRLNMLQNTGNTFATRDMALNDTITQELLSQEAKKKGYEVSDKEIEETLNKELEANGFSKEELEANLAEGGLKYEDLIKFYTQNLLVLRYINDTILSKVILAEDDAKNYYDDNKEQFKQLEQVTVKHILIGYDNQSDNETYKKAKAVEKAIDKDRDNFCDLVKEYTEDVGSKDTCGEYTFSRQDPLVPEFIEAGFGMKEDEVRIVKTQFGYHVMLKIKDIPEQILPFKEVKESIVNLLEREQVMAEYEELIKKIKDEAIIEIYTEEGQAVSNEEADQTTVSEVAVKETVKTEKSEKQEFTKCLESKNAVMYTVYWSPDNEAQLEIFGDDAKYIKIVECDADEKDADVAACKEAGVTIYPSWVVDGKLIEGFQSERSLKTATGC